MSYDHYISGDHDSDDLYGKFAVVRSSSSSSSINFDDEDG